MIRKSDDGEELKKGQTKAEEGTGTGFKKGVPSTDTLDEDLIEEVEPADFFDPEEFGIRRALQQPSPLKAAPGPYGCLWCRIPLTRDDMSKHHAYHGSIAIDRAIAKREDEHQKAFERWQERKRKAHG